MRQYEVVAVSADDNQSPLHYTITAKDRYAAMAAAGARAASSAQIRALMAALGIDDYDKVRNALADSLGFSA